MPSEPAKVAEFLTGLDKEADEALLNSSRMPGLDVNSESDMKRAFDVFSKDTDTIEWRAIMLTVLAQHSLKLLNGDSSREELAHAIARTVAAHVMLVYKQSLETHVWAGYEQTRLVYNVAAAGASTPTEALAIEALRPAFENLSEDVLAAWVGAEVSIKDKFNIQDIDESVVNALARYHLAQFNHRRQKDVAAGEAKSRKWANLIAAGAVGAALVGVLVTVLIALGVISASKPTSHSTPAPSATSPSHPHRSLAASTRPVRRGSVRLPMPI